MWLTSLESTIENWAATIHTSTHHLKSHRIHLYTHRCSIACIIYIVYSTANTVCLVQVWMKVFHWMRAFSHFVISTVVVIFLLLFLFLFFSYGIAIHSLFLLCWLVFIMNHKFGGGVHSISVSWYCGCDAAGVFYTLFGTLFFLLFASAEVIFTSFYISIAQSNDIAMFDYKIPALFLMCTAPIYSVIGILTNVLEHWL